MDLSGLGGALLEVNLQEGHTAAVTALFRDAPAGAEILLVVRQVRDGDPWSGQVALPGGRARPGERPSETAAREMLEEVGIDLRDCATVLGCLPLIAPANKPEMAVVPQVAVLTRDVPAVCGEEVTAAHWVPFHALTANEVRVVRHLHGDDREFPAFAHGHLEVWGLTHRILTELRSLLPE
ncbi:MAG TPA: CoA pyrophosphatase [Thermoplasmata archaeon]|nr:CoA pyrophosphatase [Thermoplasmata archaeon]